MTAKEDAKRVLAAFNGRHELVNRSIKLSDVLYAAADTLSVNWSAMECMKHLREIADELSNAP